MLAAFSLAGLSNVFKGFFQFIWDILKITIPLPLVVILVAGIWWYFDTNSRVKNAVEQAVKELVAGAELDSMQAQLKFKDIVIDRQATRIQEEKTKAENSQRALEQLESQRVTDEAEFDKELQERIDAINKSRPAPSTSGSNQCPDDSVGDLFDGLRNK